MSIALTDKTIDDYWSLISRLDNNSKKKLIIRLAESIETKEESKYDLESLFGAWEDSRDSDEIIKEIREKL
jgi:protein tyrosine phosphatase